MCRRLRTVAAAQKATRNVVDAHKHREQEMPDKIVCREVIVCYLVRARRFAGSAGHGYVGSDVSGMRFILSVVLDDRYCAGGRRVIAASVAESPNRKHAPLILSPHTNQQVSEGSVSDRGAACTLGFVSWPGLSRLWSSYSVDYVDRWTVDRLL